MWQAQVRVDLDAIEHNVRLLRDVTRAAGHAKPQPGPGAEVMAVVKGDGYGHGMVPAARAALRGGATWLGACTVPEALELRAAGITAPVFAWLIAPGVPLDPALLADVDLGTGSVGRLAEIVDAASRTERTARVHLKIDTGLARGGARPDDWPALCEAAAKAETDGLIEVVGVWSHLVRSDEPEHPTNDDQLAAFQDGLDVAGRWGITPRYRHLANSGALLTRPDLHFDLVRPGIACYGLSPLPPNGPLSHSSPLWHSSPLPPNGPLSHRSPLQPNGPLSHSSPVSPSVPVNLRPAMTVRARVVSAKRVPASQGVSYGHTYRTTAETTLALVPLGYADGVPRAASNRAPVRLHGSNRTIAGRVCMDQIVLDCGDDPIEPGEVAVLFGPGDDGEPTADDWAQAADTINYEIVTRFGSARVPREYDGG